jgi:rhodanese-related sulfurtransferase
MMDRPADRPSTTTPVVGTPLDTPAVDTPAVDTPAVDVLLERARARISRVGPREAARLAAEGALLVDTRPLGQRQEHGEIPGSLIVDRNVLEWRLDPTSPYRHEGIAWPEPPSRPVIVVFCQEGYSSSLAVASLVDIGWGPVHDLDGGFAAWAACGLPLRRSGAT